MKPQFLFLSLWISLGIPLPQINFASIAARKNSNLSLLHFSSQQDTLNLAQNGKISKTKPYDLPWRSKIHYFGRNATSSNLYTSVPSTGITRKYSLVLSRGRLSPDGVEKEMILINGQFPGPMISADWGDWIQVKVENRITGPEEGTSIHWHGFLQSTSQWSDGVPGTTECPIIPGGSRTYLFQAQVYGSSWYHSHYSAQYVDGAWGPLIVNGPSLGEYDEDLGPILLSDHYYRPYFDIIEDVMGNDLTKVRPASDNTLVNGRGCSEANSNIAPATAGANCTDLARFAVQKGKRYRLRLINTSAAAIHKFSIDGHKMKVISYDFVPIQPYDTNVVTLGVAQRADVVITADGDNGEAYWLRSHVSDGQCTEPSNQPNGRAILQYSEPGWLSIPSSVAQVDSTDPCENDPLEKTQPLFPVQLQAPSQTFEINVNFTVNATGHLNWDMNKQTYHANFNDPILLLAKDGNVSYPYNPEWNTLEIDPLSQSVRVILHNLTPTSHPMHLHGHNMYVLAAGIGSWDNEVVNPLNPMRRDVHILPANGYLVIQWDNDNPGVWPLHCHIAWHVSAGLQVTMIENPSRIRALTIPDVKFQECDTWNQYSQKVVVNQIDSGV